MPVRVEVASDVVNEGAALQRKIKDGLGIETDSIFAIDVYTIDGIRRSKAELLGQELFADPITHRSSLGPIGSDRDWDYAVEIGYWPGVTDNTGNTASAAMVDVIGESHPTFTSRQYLLKGVSREQAEEIAAYLHNPLIQRAKIKSRRQWGSRNGMGVYLPVVRLEDEPGIEYVNLDVSDEELARIGKGGILDEVTGERRGPLGASLEEMKVAAQYKNLWTDCELEAFFQTNSEHCKHKIFAATITYEEDGRVEVIDSLFNTYIRGATEALRERGLDWLVSVFGDNAGIIKLDDEYNIAFKVETHNSPSALDPYGGAITGVDGVARDIMGVGLGAREIGRVDVFCFASPFYSGELPPRIFHPKRIHDGVRSGVRDGGNKCGVPTINGSIRFDSHPYGTVVENETIISYMGKPLIYVGSLGTMPAYINGRPMHEKKANPSDAIILVGAKTGKDGIHGATFSSEALQKGSPATAVQLDEPYTQKKTFDFLLEARNRSLYSSITDNGAGGLSCSVGEMAQESGGAELYLDKVPLKYTGMQPWEILLSESQDRMTLAVAPEKVDEFLDLARRRGAEATVVGKYNDTGYFRVVYGDKLAAELELEFLHNGVPRKQLNARWRQPRYEEPQFKEPDIDWALMELLARPNIASKESTVRMYDHEVQAQTVVKPFTGTQNDGPSDAAVSWPLEMQRKNSFRGVAVGHGINANYGLIDTYHMAASNIDEAIRNVVAVGADPSKIALLDNFCWSSSDNEYRLAQLVRACKACYDYAVAYGTPFISGKDSMFNDYKDEETGIQISVPPTLLISALGIVPDIRKSVTMDAKQPGNIIYVVGTTHEELGGSEYYAMLGSQRGEAWIGNRAPIVNAQQARRIYAALAQATKNNWVAGYHDCSDGGLAVTLAEIAFAGDHGMKIYLDRVPRTTQRNDYTMFSESNSRVVAQVPEEYASRFESLLNGNAKAIGRIGGNNLSFYSDGHNIMSVPVYALKEAWQGTLKW